MYVYTLIFNSSLEYVFVINNLKLYAIIIFVSLLVYI